MTIEHQTTALRVIDVDQLRKNFEAIEARRADLTLTGQRLLARIRPTSKYHGQGGENELFPVCIGPGSDYVVLGGPGGQYRLKDVDLFAVFYEGQSPTQITFDS